MALAMLNGRKEKREERERRLHVGMNNVTAQSSFHNVVE
jgi:hypothetical protein